MGCRILKQVCKTEPEQKLYGFDYSGFDDQVGTWGFLARVWRPGTIFVNGVSVRPSVPTGYQYAVANTGQGQSGATEPKWPRVIGETVQDGSIVWQCEAVSDASLTATIVTSAWSSDSDVTLSDEILENADGVHRTSVQVAGGSLGQKYEVRNLVVFSDGSTEESALRVQIS